MARSHYENFPVASRLLPKAMRPHVSAVYAYARVADDMADEGDAPAVDRLAQLSAWQKRLHTAVAVQRSSEPPRDREDLIIVAAAHSIRSLDLPLTLFDDLLSAFGQDTMTTRYASWTDLFEYCRRSANPVGRLVLRIGGYRDTALDRSSDALCTALQLTNFWQDLGRDWRAGRLYVPRDVQERCGADETELSAGLLSPAWVQTIRECVSVTRSQLGEGRSVCDEVRGRLRFELRVTWLGGERILTRVEQAGESLLRARPALGAGDVGGLAWGAVTWGAHT